MPQYNYQCLSCKLKQVKKFPEDKVFLIPDEEKDDFPLIWEEIHSMTEDVVIKCPVCGEEATKTLMGIRFQSYTKGNCYLDKTGCKIDMARHQLDQGDPYAGHRESGELGDLKDRMKKAGKRGYDNQGNSTVKHYPKK